MSFTELGGNYNPSSSSIHVTVPNRGSFYIVVTIIFPEHKTACLLSCDLLPVVVSSQGKKNAQGKEKKELKDFS